MGDGDLYTDPIRQIHAFLRGVRLAGGWRRYVNVPRADLFVLRALCLRGRATPAGVFVNLFAPTAPTPIAWHILTFWRNERDYP